MKCEGMRHKPKKPLWEVLCWPDKRDGMAALMNDTKLDEFRRAMYGLESSRPFWRTKDLSGDVTCWDRDWRMHFRTSFYSSIEWVDIKITSSDQDALVLASLRQIRVPGQRTEDGFRIYGYVPHGAHIHYV
jgi:monoamine oxidase